MTATAPARQARPPETIAIRVDPVSEAARPDSRLPSGSAPGVLLAAGAVLDDRGVDLDELDQAVFARTVRWRAAEARWEIARWPVTDKPAASLRVETAVGMAELTMWVSGEADLVYLRHPETEPVTEHYELTAALGLVGCLDDLEGFVGLRS